MVGIKRSCINELESFPEFHRVLDEYAEESSIKGLPYHTTRMEMYKQLENVKMLTTVIAAQDTALVGFITVLCSALPHYGVVIATCESFFVRKQYRKTGAGLKLLHEAEGIAKEAGSPGLLVSAPFQGALFEVLPHVGYRETNRIFFREF